MQDTSIHRADPIVYNTWDHLHQEEQAQEQIHLEQGAKNGKNKKSLLFKFLMLSIIAMVLALLYGTFQYFSKNNQVSGDKIGITTDISDYVDGGVVSTSTVYITNKNQIILENVRIKVDYKKGISPTGDSDMIYIEQSVGSVGVASGTSISIPLVFYGQEGDSRNINIEMLYKISGSNAEFSKLLTKTVSIKAPLVTLNIDAANNVIADHEVTLTARLKNVGQDNFTPSVLSIEVPAGFVVKKSTSTDPTKFRINSLFLGQELSFSVTGYFKNSIGQVKTFRSYVSTQKGDTVGSSFATAQHEISIINEPVQSTYILKVNNQVSANAVNGLPADIELTLANKSDNALDNLTIYIKTNRNEQLMYDENKKDTYWLQRVIPGSQNTIFFTLQNLVSPTTTMSVEVYGKMRGSTATVLLEKSDLPIIVR